MPVTTAELVAPDGKPGAATGAGSFDPGTDATKPWPPAIHNKFDDKIDDNPTFTNLDKAVNDPKAKATSNVIKMVCVKIASKNRVG